MPSPEIALAASAREWSDRLHRFVLDHGGGTVRGRMMSAEQAISSQYEVLLIDDICSFLTPRLVADVRATGKGVIGVFDPEDGSDAKRRLLEAGISDVIETGAPPEEFLLLARSTIAYLPPPGEIDAQTGGGIRIGVTGPPGGVGVTEIACGVAVDLAIRHRTALVDANQAWPGVGQRLGLPVHPNLMTAADLVIHEPDRFDRAIRSFGSLDVVCGVANPSLVAVSPGDLFGIVAALAREHSHVVVDLGPVPSSFETFPMGGLDVLLLVGAGNPIGVTRLLRAYEDAAERLGPQGEIGLVVNRVDRSPRQRAEISAMLSDSVGGTPMVMIPEDLRMRRWVWDGAPAGRGDFSKSVHKLAAVFDGVDRDR